MRTKSLPTLIASRIRSLQKLCWALATCLVAGTAWSGVLPLNPAIADFEYVDLANTVVASAGLALTNSEAWTVEIINDADGDVVINFDSGKTPPSGLLSMLMNTKDEDDAASITSTNLGVSMVEGNTYRFSFDSFEDLTGTKEFVFEVHRYSDNEVLSSNRLAAVHATWTKHFVEYVAGASDAGDDLYLKIWRDSAVHGNKAVRIDNIVLEEIGDAFTDSARVLAFNVDGNKDDFEYLATGVGVGVALNSALDGAASGGSVDASYGTFDDPAGANSNSPAAYPWAANGTTFLEVDVTITNTSAHDLKLNGLYFDIFRSTDTSLRRFEMEYVAGDLSDPTGQLYAVTLYTTTGTGSWKDFDWTFGSQGENPSSAPVAFNAMSDRVLGTNETATFRLIVKSSTDAATEPDAVLVDNIALVGDFIPDGVLVDWGSPDMFFGDEGNVDLRLGSHAATTNGNLLIRNYHPEMPILDRSLGDGFYQAQPLHGMLQVGNKGALAESTGFRYARLAGGNPSAGSMILTAEPATNATDIYQSSLVYVKAGDFYDDIGVGENLTSLSMNIDSFSADVGEVRFAVLNDDQWFVSSAKATAAGTFALSFPIAENAWAAFSPATTGATSMASAKGLFFDTTGVDFTNIQAVGYFMEGEDLVDATNVSFRVDDFEVLIGEAPSAFPKSEVLAYNVDDVREDFEFVKGGVDFTLTMISLGNGSATSQGSLDGSLGSFQDPVSADTNSPARPWAGRGDTPLVAEMTIGNVTPDSSLGLSGFHFDLYRHQVASIAARQIQLEYISGDLAGVSSGLVYQVIMEPEEFVSYEVTNVVEGVTNITTILPWADFDWTFASIGNIPSAGTVVFNPLADMSLAYGESATFRFSIQSSTTAEAEGNQTRLDNIAFLGSLKGVGFGSWISSFGLAPADRDAEDDPDLDGLSNLEEYARNGDPNDIGNTGTASTIEVAAGVLNYVHPQRSDDDNLLYYVEVNDNLVHGTWTNSGYDITGTNVTGVTLDYVTNAVPTTDKAAKFIRLKVQQM
ncbi:hypothetical protein PDESU_02731 [Pontiella desulfatans]|uniref:Uncharacterized protein n=1 Tax=Pontiella desulfatans TaxID=2750659 RepID=A0A6C2U2F7_PONDE|nr:hypothetical protein [Pontiella desulfatans]VGO14172.1 hypothetical protein PDESU_02731 [Pontiella desulfatans]